VGMYCATQIFAGICAGAAYSVMFGASIPLQPAKGFGWVSAGSAEFFYTFMLVFVVLNVAASKKQEKEGNHWYGLAIGWVIIAGAYGAGAISGGCFNPAVAIGIDLSSFSHGIGWCLWYSCCELVAAVFAVALFKVVRPADFDPEAVKGKAQIIVGEFLGTFMLVLTVGLNVLGKSPAAAFSIAASLMCMIYALGDVCGAHFNPAVTLAIFAAKGDPDMAPADVAIRMGTQVVAGISAAFTYMLMYFKSFPLQPGAGFGLGSAMFCETMFTFVLCLVVLCAACSPKTGSKQMFGLAIGSCVTVGGFAAGAVSGGSLNPAVSWGIAMAAPLALGKSSFYAGMYSLAEFAGAGAAAGVYMVTHADTAKKEEDLSA